MSRSRRASSSRRTSAVRLFNREQSWIEFNARVLAEALDRQTPLLERAKFLAICSTNMDEFFMIRVAGLREQQRVGVQTTSPDGLTPSQQLQAIRSAVTAQLAVQRECWLTDVNPALRSHGIWVFDYAELTAAQQAAANTYYVEQIQPVLTPLAFDASHPFPLISNLSLNLAVVIGTDANQRFVRVKIPGVLPRLIPVALAPEHIPADLPADACHGMVWIEQVIAANLQQLFPGERVHAVHAFRITRNADFEIEEDEADDLLATIEENVRQRRFGAVVRIAVQHDMPPALRTLLLNNLHLDPDDLYEIRGQLGLSALMHLMRLDRPELKDTALPTRVPAVLRDLTNPGQLWDIIRQRDVVMHHPYDSFQPVIDFIEAAATDPDVLAIKQTLYRVGNNSPIVHALMRARDLDKQVTVLVELKARFDEENNITWARALERAGVHVVYGVPNLKTHAKMALVIRREGQQLRRYAHLGTGNYNAGTSRIYTDIGVLTSNAEVTADVANVFNYLTGYARHETFAALLVAPVNMRQRLAGMIDREIVHAAAGRPARLIFKANSLVDPAMVEHLYRASNAGVSIDLIIRGMCCVIPGVAGMSANIRIRSIVGRFLEHSRVYWFGNDGSPEVYIGSADLMERNLDRRVETLLPIQDPAIRGWIRDHFLETYLQDTERARLLSADGSWQRLRDDAHEHRLDCQQFFARVETMES